MSIDDATFQLLEHIGQNTDHIFRSIQHIRLNLSRNKDRWSSKEAIRLVLELCRDEIFVSSLAGTKLRTSKSLELYYSGHTSDCGLTDPPLEICLNHNLVELLQKVEAVDDLIALVLHHLIHAYFVVKCGTPRVEQEYEDVFGHGIEFAAILYKIKEVSGGDVYPPLPMTAGFPSFTCEDDNLYRKLLPPYSVASTKLGCLVTVQDIPEEVVQAWIRANCDKLPSSTLIYRLGDDNEFSPIPLSQYGDPTSFILLSWQDKLYHLSSSCLHSIDDLAPLFSNPSKPLLLPEPVTESELKHFITFCQTKTYSSPLTTTQTPLGHSPAILLPPSPPTTNQPSILQTDIKMFHLGAHLPFPSLQLTALSRLNAHHFTHEDPIAVLTALFTSRKPDARLLTWLAGWLRRRVPDDAVPIGESPKVHSNWAVITSGHRGRLEALLRKPECAELRSILACAEANLEALPVRAPPPQPPLLPLGLPLFAGAVHNGSLSFDVTLDSGLYVVVDGELAVVPSYGILELGQWGPVTRVMGSGTGLMWESQFGNTPFRAVRSDSSWELDDGVYIIC
jgi:hypothetical protein